jgi:hypothetical protein
MENKIVAYGYRNGASDIAQFIHISVSLTYVFFTERIQYNFTDSFLNCSTLCVPASQFLPSIMPVSLKQLMGQASSASLSLKFSQQQNNQQLRSQADRASKPPESSKHTNQSCHSLSFQQSSQADTTSKPLESLQQSSQAGTASPPHESLQHLSQADTASMPLESLQQSSQALFSFV